MSNFDPERSEYLREWLCSPPKPSRKEQPKTRTVTSEAGLPDRRAVCPLCQQEVGYTDLFGYGGHCRKGSPGFEKWKAGRGGRP